MGAKRLDKFDTNHKIKSDLSFISKKLLFATSGDSIIINTPPFKDNKPKDAEKSPFEASSALFVKATHHSRKRKNTKKTGDDYFENEN